MVKARPQLDDPDYHAQVRDIKARRKHRLTDNRSSVRLIAKLGSQIKKK